MDKYYFDSPNGKACRFLHFLPQIYIFYLYFYYKIRGLLDFHISISPFFFHLET